MHIVLASIHSQPSPQAMPLAAAFLKAYLANDPELSTAVKVSLADFYLSQTVSECAASLLALNPKAIGFSIYVWNRCAALEIMAAVRKVNPEIMLFAGGPETTADPNGILHGGNVDFVVVGEGEYPFRQAMNEISHGRNPSGIFGHSSTATEFQTLDDIPSPFSDQVLDVSRYDGVLWQLSRGCSFKCDFCFDHKGGGKVRRFSLSRIENELHELVRKGVSQVFVLDSTFNEDMPRAKKILRLIAAIAPDLHFHFEVRSEFLDKELAALFSDITCSLQIGLQSCDPVILRNVSRSFNPHDFSKRIDLLNHAGVIFGFDLIYGLPGDTLSGFTNSLDYALRLYPNHLDIFPLAILPGTRLSKNPPPGLVYATAPPYTLLESSTFPAEEMTKARHLAEAADIFYSRGKAVAWFNTAVKASGCTPTNFLEEFWRWLTSVRGLQPAESELEDNEIWLLQREFVKYAFSSRKKATILPVLLDLIDYHYHYAAVLMSPRAYPDESSYHADPLKSRLVLASSARLVSFNYDISDVLDAGDMDPFLFIRQFRRSGSHAALFSDGRELHTEVLELPYFQLLHDLNQQVPPETSGSKKMLTSAEKRQFLLWALDMGLVVQGER